MALTNSLQTLKRLALVSSAKRFSVFRNNITNVDFCWVYLQGDLHRVQEWNAQYFAHRPELHEGGTDRVLGNRQGETLEHAHTFMSELQKAASCIYVKQRWKVI